MSSFFSLFGGNIMISRSSLKELTDELDMQMMDLESVEAKVFRNFKSIFIIKTAYITQFEAAINLIKSVNSNIKIYVVARPHEKRDVLKLCGNNSEIIEYNYEGVYSKDNMKQILENVSLENIDSSLILFNTKYGFGYSNIEEIISYTKIKNIFIYNCEKQLLQVKNIDILFKSQNLYISLCDWFWEIINTDILEESYIE